MQMTRRVQAASGQASAELIAAAGLALFLMLAVAQAVVVGYALWTAGDAARAGARAAHVGGEPERAALSALPQWIERRADVETAGPIEVTVSAPALIPGVPAIRVGAAAELPGGTPSG